MIFLTINLIVVYGCEMLECRVEGTGMKKRGGVYGLEEWESNVQRVDDS